MRGAMYDRSDFLSCERLMKSSIVLIFTAIASLFPFAVTPFQCRAGYVLTKVINQPDPTQFNPFRGVLLTDDYLAIGARTFSTPGKLGSIFLYDASGEQLLHILKDPLYHGFQSLDFGSGFSVGGGHVVASDRYDLPAVVHVFDAASGQLSRTITSPTAAHAGFTSGGARVTGDYIVVGTEAYQVGATGPRYPASIDIFDVNTGSLLRTLTPPNDAYGWGGRISVSGDTIAVGSDRPNDAKVFLFDIKTGTQLGTLQHPLVRNFTSMQFRNDKLLLGQTRGSAFLLDTSGNLLQTFPSPGTDPDVSGAYFDFCGSNILIGSFGSLNANTSVAPAARLYDSSSGALIQMLNDFAPGDRIFSVDANPSGTRLAIVRAVFPSLSTQVLVYAIPEPKTYTLGVAALCGSILLLPRCVSHSFCLLR